VSELEKLKAEYISARDRVRAIESDPVRGFPSTEDYAAVAEAAERYRDALGIAKVPLNDDNAACIAAWLQWDAFRQAGAAIAGLCETD
jgi:hypothetical protein